MSARLVHLVDQLSEVVGMLQPHGSMTVTLSREDMTELLDVAAAVERVQALHVAARFSGATRWVCSECCIDWPCPTSRALNESETGGES